MKGEQEIYDFGVRLKKLRKENGLTQKEVGARLGVTAHTIGTYENNSKVPPISRLVKLANLYRTSTDFILGQTDKQIICVDDLPMSKQEMIVEIVSAIREEHQKSSKELK